MMASTALVLAITACSESDDFTYPSIVTEMADCASDAQGTIRRITLDDGRTYTLTNPLAGYAQNAVYRAMCDYTLEPSGSATLYQTMGAYVLRDSADAPLHHPTNAESAWITPRYINLHLRPKTYGGRQYWGYVTDSIEGGTAYLSIHHNQCGDPLAYSTTVYASIPLDSIPTGSIHLSIHTFDGVKTWTFRK